MVEPALRAKIRAWRSVLLRFSLDNPLLVGLIVVLFTTATVALVTRSTFSRTPQLSMEYVGSPARADYKATRDFTYTEVDVVATEKKREEAARAVLPVYDFDLEERDRVVEQIRESFRFVQEVFDTYRSQLGGQGGSGGAGRVPAGSDVPDEQEGGALARPKGRGGELERQGAGAEGRSLPPDAVARKRELEQWLAGQLEERRDEFFRLLHQTLTQEEYALLVQLEFSRELEDNLIYLVSGVMLHKVLPSMRLLNRQREEGIRLRLTRGATSVDEIDIRDDFSEFITIQDAVERLVLMARRGLKALDPEVRDRLVDVAGRLVVPNCQYNRIETESRREKARASVENLSTTRPFRKGQIIVDRGHIVIAQHVRIFRASMQEAQEEDLLLAVVGNTLVVIGLTFILVSFFRRFVRKFAPERNDLIFLGIWSISMLFVFRVSLGITEALAESWRTVPVEAYIYLIPVAAVPMLVRMVLNSETAVVVAVLEAVFAAIMVNWNMSYLLFALAGGLTAAGGVGKAKQRTDLLQAALRTGGTNALFAFALSAIWGTLFSTEGVAMMLLAAAGGILSGLLVTALLPMVEVIFGYTTNIKLLELANLNNPLLKELAIRAPGTFHHSILVGNLVETAAESIRSNPLLARVGAYYHDVGKIKAPHYFAENQRPGQNPHDKLKPSMSALILKEHVRDGVKLLRTKGYPKILADICEQHVGTTLISFFYQKARNQASEKDEPPPLETDYRYPGPKPQTREAALVFLGDSVEAAAKSMSDPSPARLQGMVQKLISARFIDGQLSECNLTLGDLHNIARAFTRGLTGIYHFRPEYPEVKTSRRREDTGSNSRRSIQTAAVVNSRTSSRPATGPASSGGEAGAAPAREDAAPEERAESATPDAAAQAQPFQAGMSTVSVDELDSVGELASAEEDAFSQEGCGALSRLHDDIEDEARDDEQQTGRKGAGGGKAVRGPEGSRGGEERQDRPPGDEASGLRRLGCPRSG